MVRDRLFGGVFLFFTLNRPRVFTNIRCTQSNKMLAEFSRRKTVPRYRFRKCLHLTFTLKGGNGRYLFYKSNYNEFVNELDWSESKLLEIIAWRLTVPFYGRGSRCRRRRRPVATDDSFRERIPGFSFFFFFYVLNCHFFSWKRCFSKKKKTNSECSEILYRNVHTFVKNRR